MNKYRFLLVLMSLLFTEIAAGQYYIESITKATNGACNGAIEVTVDPNNAPHQFRWSVDGETNAIIDDLCPGIYSVVIEDKYGCSWELEAEVGKESGCYIQDAVFQTEIVHVCSNTTGGSIRIIPNSSTEYTYQWLHNGQNTAFVEGLSPGRYIVVIKDANTTGCSVTKTYQVETRTDCGPEPPIESIPIFVNEAFNGPSSQKEYVELVVKGDGTCAPVDLRGYIIDDNNGDFSNPNHGICGTGFSGGHIRFKYLARWAAVPPGSKIVIYNPGGTNVRYFLRDDPIDENGDGVYILPVDNNGLEGTHKYPSYSYPEYFKEGHQTTYSKAKWAYIALKDDKDAIQIRFPDGTYCHGFSFGSSDFINGGPANLHISDVSTGNEVLYFNSGSINEVSNFKSERVGEIIKLNLTTFPTPGFANNFENATFLNGIACVGGTLIVNEISNGLNEKAAYVELLVKSNGNCGAVDLRGYIIDDNNGHFSETLEESGISPGHLRFPNTDTWNNVAGGSLIVIYNESEKHDSIGIDDATDEDGDNIYILSADKLEGSAASPTPSKPYDYDLAATYSIGSWDYVNLFSYGDAMQVLAPDGGYQHGISYGALGKINGGFDDLLVEAANNKNGKVYYFNDTNPKLVANFGISTVPTPGAANNEVNQAYIAAFCIEESLVAANSRISITPNDFRAKLYPNPFRNLINIAISSPKEQAVNVQVHDLLGRQLYEQKEGLIKGYNDLSIDLDPYVSDGIYFMSIRGDGAILHEEKVICVKK